MTPMPMLMTTMTTPMPLTSTLTRLLLSEESEHDPLLD
jgi:hypothetical protein